MEIRMFGVTLVVIALVATAAHGLARQMLVRRVQNYFSVGDHDAVLKTLGGSLAQFALPAYNRDYMRLSALEGKQDFDAAGELIERMLRTKCTPRQREALLDRAFGFYVAQEDRDRAEHMLELIDSCGNKEMLRDCRQKFGIVFNGKSSYITEMQRRLPHASPRERAQLCYLISLQYSNRGEKDLAERYLRQSLQEGGAGE